ncbi:MAG: hypothetical protein ACLFVP_08925 [Candidatus Bathyarchaeia archaeon]
MSVSPSGMVYLFSDRFVEEARFLGEDVPCTDAKVKQDKLAVNLVAAAVSWLYRNHHIELHFGKRSKMLGLRKADTLVIEKVNKPPIHQDSLETILWDKAGKGDNLYDLTCKLINRKTKIPVAVIINIVKDYLVKEKYFKKQKRMMFLTQYIPDCNRIEKIEKELEIPQKLFSLMKQSEKDIYKQIFKDVEAGINTMTEADVD